MIREKIKHVNARMTKSYTSLKLTLLSNLLFSLGIAIALFFISNFLFDSYIEKKYLSDEKKAERVEEYKEDLQTYVTENNLTSDDTAQIASWAKDKKYLYILVYKDDKLLFETGDYEKETVENKENADDSTENSVDNNEGDSQQSQPPPDEDGGSEDGGAVGGASSGTDSEGSEGADNTDENGANDNDGGETNNNDADEPTDTDDNKYHTSGITVKAPTREQLISEAVERGSHPIEASDGTLLVSMADYTEYLYYDIFNIVAIFIAFSSFVLVMWVYFMDITKKITRLGREVTAVADGDTNRKITADGEDEITRLCADVEYMRISMLENIEKEHAALEANKELITAMSHDIRTPLTVLLGYLDIMKSNSPDPDMQQYLEASERTALRLKKMSDDMFGYFLVYGGGIEVEVEECDAKTLVDQMLSGHVFLLREQGYAIDFNFEGEDENFLENVTVVTDPPQLMRIVENLFSNVMKYADKDKPVTIHISSGPEEMTIKVSNYIATNPDEAQRNGIGLRSCVKLANAMDIRFLTEEADGVFTSILHIPIIPDIDYSVVENTEESGEFEKWLKSVSEKLKSFFKTVFCKVRDFFVKTFGKIKGLLTRKK